MDAKPDNALFVIRSNSGGAQVEVFGSDGRRGCTVRLSRRELQAQREVYEIERCETLRGLADFFTELAGDWRGWEGQRAWASLEGEFALVATHDRLGTVELAATLAQVEPVDAGLWSASTSLFLDAGGLDRLAREAANAASGP